MAAALMVLGIQSSSAQAVSGVNKDATADRAVISYQDGTKKVVAFYGPRIFRVFYNPQAHTDAEALTLTDPQAKPEAKILVDNAKQPAGQLSVSTAANGDFVISTSAVRISVGKANGLMRVENLKDSYTVVEETAPAQVENGKAVLTLRQSPDEYFFGGGVQNGRFSHKGKVINIVNENSWTDGGVCSPAPFYWSTGGYAFMAYTFQPGAYDFGSKDPATVTLSHSTDYIDYFLMVDDGAVALLNDYYQLTGHPVLLPKFGFYEGHLNAYNRDYWKEAEPGSWGAVPFEDGKYYRESQKDNGGIHETLNGWPATTGNTPDPNTIDSVAYQFSARAVVDRYRRHDMPLGWVLPNDGYGAGYGQASTLEGNVQNLRLFGDYARSNGVEIGLWTQSDLHPIDTIAPLLQRDIVREIRDAGVRVLKTDVAWVGAGYSFGLNGISEVAKLMPQYGHGARPFIISLDGWAGTQRYAGVWSGDQTGGQWEYIRFHIPTFIGAGLAGMPNITSDMDGIFGGRNPKVNIREFQWKTFTPMQLNMDGWGSNEKYPHALGEPATSLNRAYLKMKSMLMPYTYSIAHEAVSGKPMIRALMLDEPNAYTLSAKTEYEYLYGPSILVAPIYQETQADTLGNDIRHNIYLPRGEWTDYFSGNTYQGGAVLNSYDAPLWKLPVLIKAGAIIPITKANNNPSQIDTGLRIYDFYPQQSATGNAALSSAFTEYDDDGHTVAYLEGESVSTPITMEQRGADLILSVSPAKGSFQGFRKDKATIIRVVGVRSAAKIIATVGGKKVKLSPAKGKNLVSLTQTGLSDSKKGTFLYGARIDYNRFFTKPVVLGGDTVKMQSARALEIALPATDIALNGVEIRLEGCQYCNQSISTRSALEPAIALAAPSAAGVKDADQKPYSLRLSWNPVEGAEAYEIQYDGMNYFDIRDCSFLFENLKPETAYSFRLRATAKGKASPWTDLTARTKRDPYEFAVKGITAQCTAPSQGGQGLRKLFDFDRESAWHTQYGEKATPFTMIVDLHALVSLDKMEYLPRQSGTNGILQQGSVSISTDKQNWQQVGTIGWPLDASLKTFAFSGNPSARYIRIDVEAGGGDFGSGQELYVYRKEGSPVSIPGDINNDGRLDENDLTSYMNYTGLRQGDADFDGYVSGGDVNHNGLIDAYDISNAAVEVNAWHTDRLRLTPALSGTISVRTDKATYRAGEEITLTVQGKDLKDVNAFSLSLPYSEAQMTYVGTEADGAKGLDNYTRDRLHTNGAKAVYVTFVGKGDAEPLNGDMTLCTLKFRALKSGPAALKAQDILLVDKELHSLSPTTAK